MGYWVLKPSQNLITYLSGHQIIRPQNLNEFHNVCFSYHVVGTSPVTWLQVVARFKLCIHWWVQHKRITDTQMTYMCRNHNRITKKYKQNNTKAYNKARFDRYGSTLIPPEMNVFLARQPETSKRAFLTTLTKECRRTNIFPLQNTKTNKINVCSLRFGVGSPQNLKVL